MLLFCSFVFWDMYFYFIYFVFVYSPPLLCGELEKLKEDFFLNIFLVQGKVKIKFYVSSNYVRLKPLYL